MKKLFLTLTAGFVLTVSSFAAPGANALAKESESMAPLGQTVLPSLFMKSVTVEESLEAGRGFSGGSRLGTGFKSIKNFNTPKSTGTSSGFSGSSGSSGPTFFGFFPIPFMGGSGSGGDLFGTLIILGIIGAVIWFVFVKPRMGGNGFGSKANRDETAMLIDRCERNMEVLTEEYLKGQRSLEVLKGRVNDAEYRDWENDYGKINLSALERELADAKSRIKTEASDVVQARLFSFDEDAEKINQFLEDLNERARAYLDNREII